MIQATISVFEGKISCNVLGCESLASFAWAYTHSDREPVNRIASTSNVIDWIGTGTYICTVNCGNESATAVQQLNSGRNYQPVNTPAMVPGELLLPSKAVPKFNFWDFSKLPENEIQTVIDLVEAKEWKKLAKIHNDNKLSSSHYCCDMTDVAKNFTEYATMLRLQGSVVGGAE